jgi:hypothetical protein
MARLGKPRDQGVIAATGLLPTHVWAVRWFIRSARDEDLPALPDPAQPRLPEPTSNVRLLPRRTDSP